jgi:hypothetical protein
VENESDKMLVDVMHSLDEESLYDFKKVVFSIVESTSCRIRLLASYVRSWKV